MNADPEHKITIKIADVEPFKLRISESEESFYRMVLEKFNANVDRFRYGTGADSTEVALCKVGIYYATMLYKRTHQINTQAELLRTFEERLDSLLEGTEQ